MGVEVWPCERCNGSGHVGWFRLTPCPSCRASIRKHLPTGTAGVGDDTRLLDALENEKLLTGSFYPFDGVWRIEMHGDEYEGPTLRDAIRAALAASTRTGDNA